MPDDPTIPDEADVWRLVLPLWMVPGDNGVGVRPSTAAFDDSSDGDPMSAILARSGRDPRDVVPATSPDAGVVAFWLDFFAMLAWNWSARRCGRNRTTSWSVGGRQRACGRNSCGAVGGSSKGSEPPHSVPASRFWLQLPRPIVCSSATRRQALGAHGFRTDDGDSVRAAVR